MLTPAHQLLITLQNHDTHRLSLERQLLNIPAQIALAQEKIAGEKASIETARAELRQLEADKKLIETETGALEASAAKYKTQQNLVKKNDEYQALGHQIAETEKAIDTLEEKEIALLFRMDEARARFTEAETALKQNIAVHEARAAELNAIGQKLAAELADARAAVASARAALDAAALDAYDRVAARQHPVIVPLQADTCGGCHLKVSSEAVGLARGKSHDLAFCDQCGRILFHA